MKLKDIYKVEADKELLKEYKQIYQQVKEKFHNNDEIFEEIKFERGYAKNIYRGKIKQGINITPLELSMYLDGGFSHFGGSSYISENNNFEVVIYID